ncbi:hypothetical protein ACFY12_35095 [Streptomyces sp. NPDC001339]|uniref:hypothetical protein n=1 Tax=Streptomyces sp. NPDC001339 TaxID=3364563 RepID=UPI0036BF8F9C
MITVRLADDRRRVLLEADGIAELVVDALAAEHAEDPKWVPAMLDEVARRRRTWEGLASLEETRELPEHVVNSAAAALDAIRESVVASLGQPIDFALSEKDARRLAADLAHHADMTTTARVRKRAAQ